MKPVIEIQGLSKEFKIGEYISHHSLRDSIVNLLSGENSSRHKSFMALKDIDLQVHRGEALGMIGKNGAGKSTLLKILSRITPPSTGKVMIRGRTASLLEVGTGFHAELTGRENIFFNGSLLGLKKWEIKDKFDSIVDFSGVEKFIDTPLKRYSSGMYVRLAFAVAAHLEPEILMVDEVLAVGDIEFQKKCIEKMDEVTREGRTVLFVSHNMETIEKLCKRGILLSQGSVLQDGPIGQIVEQYIEENTLKINDSEDAFAMLRTPASALFARRIELLDTGHKAIKTVRLGESCTFRVHYECAGTSHDFFTFRITIYNAKLNIVGVFISETGNLKGIQVDQEKKYFDINVEELLLIPSYYFLSVELLVKGTRIDAVSRGFRFEVTYADLFGSGMLPDLGVITKYTISP